MFDTICSTIPVDGALPARVARLEALRRVLDGTLYDNLPYQFHEERNGAGEYIPLRLRRPSVRYGLCRVVVEDSVALLFSAGHFPVVEAQDAGLARVLADIFAEARLNEVMIDAALRGAVGSVAVLFRVLGGADLIAQGYEDVDPAGLYWFQRVWDTQSESWFVPWPVDDPLARPVKDESRSVAHGLGFVPVVWIKNLPGGDGVDGACTFPCRLHSRMGRRRIFAGFAGIRPMVRGRRGLVPGGFFRPMGRWNTG